MPITSTDRPQYRLAAHVRACHVDGQVVLLDLRRNKYVGVGGPHLGAVSRTVVDWPTCGGESMGPEQSLDPRVDRLLEQHLLTLASDDVPQQPPLDAPTESFAPATVHEMQFRDCGRFLRLCWSAATSSRSLKHRCLSDIATGVARRRDRQRPSTAWSAVLEDATAAYLHLRPFVLTAHDQCLRESLTLIRFLSQEGLFPRWVVGVRTRPFGAHSWVQSGGLVLNDLHENVRAFTPILVV